jgi:putative N6-adenine-specific DNA methylase
MCGSGTILIEAAMIAANRAPGLKRAFAVERWPQLGAQAVTHLADLRERPRRRARTVSAVRSSAFDKNPCGVVKVAQHNAKTRESAKRSRLPHGTPRARSDVPADAPLSSSPPAVRRAVG